MRKLLAACLLALSLAGCAQLQAALQAGSLITATINNPVTPDRLNAVENTMIIAFAGLNAYKQACLKGAADVNCRSNIAAIQAYTRRIPPLLTQLRLFVRMNDQVNAIVVYNQIQGLIAAFKSTAATAGVPMGG